MKTEQYFNEIQKELVEAGFILAFRTQLHTDETPFHISCKWARHTNLCFHKLNKCFLFSLQYEEKEREQETEHGYWGIELHTRYPFKWEMVPGYGEAVETREFHSYGRCTERERRAQYITVQQTYQQPVIKELTPKQILQSILDLYEPVKDHIAIGKFPVMHMSSLYPYYTFPDSEEIFWDKTDLRYMKGAVVNFFQGQYFKERYGKRPA